MTELEAIQTVVMQVAIQAATAAVMVMREVHAGPASGINAISLAEVYRIRPGCPAFR